MSLLIVRIIKTGRISEIERVLSDHLLIMRSRITQVIGRKKRGNVLNQ